MKHIHETCKCWVKSPEFGGQSVIMSMEARMSLSNVSQVYSFCACAVLGKIALFRRNTGRVNYPMPTQQAVIFRGALGPFTLVKTAVFKSRFFVLHHLQSTETANLAQVRNFAVYLDRYCACRKFDNFPSIESAYNCVCVCVCVCACHVCVCQYVCACLCMCSLMCVWSVSSPHKCPRLVISIYM